LADVLGLRLLDPVHYGPSVGEPLFCDVHH